MSRAVQWWLLAMNFTQCLYLLSIRFKLERLHMDVWFGNPRGWRGKPHDTTH